MKAASHHRTIALHALAAALCAAGVVNAAEIDTGNPDLNLRFDNTIKFNYGHRIQGQNANLLKSANFDDGDRNFAKGTVSKRIDWLTEFDLVYQNRMGLRVSAAAWNDAAYDKFDNTNLASSNHLGADGKPAIGLSNHTLRYHRRSGELLDAFMFTSFELADMPVNIKLGRHTLYWGESLATPVHGLNYGQSPIDLLKAYSVPGTDAKELFMPRAALSTQMSVTPTLALAAQYFLEWKPARLPESGSFLGFYDYGFQGAETFNLGPLGVAGKMDDSKAPKRGDFGVSARWSPDWLDGTAGLYLRRTSELLPQANLRLAGLPAAMFGATGAALCKAAIPGSAVVGANCLFYPAALGASSKYQLEYASNIDILGLSLSKSIAGISVGADLSYRRNMPLNSTPAMLMPVGTAPAILAALNGKLNPTLLVVAGALPAEGEVSGARGNTIHGVLNLLGTMAKTPLSDAATWSTELVWNRRGAVTQGAALFKGRDNYPGIDKVTKDFYGIAANFTPTWFQVMPGVDMSAPMSYSRGLKGQSAVQVGGNEGAGSASVGVAFDVRAKYRFDFKYVGFFGPLTLDATGAVSSFGGASSLLKDRGFLAATFKTTF
jgi:hypothetical protein